MLYWIRFNEHDVEMQQAMTYVAERYSKAYVMGMTDCELGYFYGKLLAREHRANRPHWYF